jgi:hypothetical protein
VTKLYVFLNQDLRQTIKLYFLCLFVKVLLAFNFIIQLKFFVFAFSILVIILLISYFVLIPFTKVLFVFNLALQLKFLIFFSFWSLFFFFLIYFLGLFVKFYWLSISSFNQSLCYFSFFNFTLILLICFFLLLKLFFNSI